MTVLKQQMISEDQDLVNDDSWMISYIDVFVLVSTVFVLLFVLKDSELNELKLAQASPQASTVYENVVDLSDSALLGPAVRQHSGSVAFDQAPNQILNQEWLRDIVALIKSNGLESHVSLINDDANFIELAIQSRVLFGSGSAELTRSGERVLEDLVPLLKAVSGLIFIEGHTDDMPLVTLDRNSIFSSNWALASARAEEVLQFFVVEDFAKSRLRSASYAGTRPIKPNDSEGNRQKNRRVSLMIQRRI